jgi:hypothetical protein
VHFPVLGRNDPYEGEIMLCLPCLMAASDGIGGTPSPAVTISNGDAMCMPHALQIRRYAPAHPVQVPVPNTMTVAVPVWPPAAVPQPVFTQQTRPAPTFPAPQPAAVPAATQPVVHPPVLTTAAPAGVPEPELVPLTGHATCTDCGRWAEPHYDPENPHCGCGAALLAGSCETVLTETGELGEVIASLAPRP